MLLRSGVDGSQLNIGSNFLVSLTVVAIIACVGLLIIFLNAEDRQQVANDPTGMSSNWSITVN